MTKQKTFLDKLYKSYFDNALHGVAIHEMLFDNKGTPADYIFLDINEAFEKDTGLKRDMLIGNRVLDVLPNTEKYWIEKYGSVVLTGKPVIFENYSQELGKYFHVEAYKVGPKHFAVETEDITGRKENQIALEHLKSAVEQASETILITDLKGTITYVNPAFEKTTGYTQEEAIGQNPRILKSGLIQEGYYKNMWLELSEGRVWKGHFINMKKSGTFYHVDAAISPVKDTENELIGHVAVMRDVTKELSLEENLRQSEKMEAIGYLAGGIAHDFNNILAGIIGFAQISLSQIDEKHPLYKNLTMILKSSDRATAIVDQILTFSRANENERSVISLPFVLDEVVELTSSTLPDTISLSLKIEPNTLPIRGEEDKIHEAVLNLLQNALYAVGKEGHVEVALATESLEKEKVTLFDIIPAGLYTVITIADSGHGIRKEQIAKIFDPFFTTKSMGEGTGMGLSVVQGVVKASEGYIEVESRRNVGTTFNLYFPVTQNESPKSEPTTQNIPQGTQHILLVEDEQLVLTILEEILLSLGYTVEAYTNPLEALKRFEETPQQFDLLYTDHTMPLMTGLDLAKKIKALREDIPIILITGNEEELHSSDISCIDKILKKPQKIESIALELYTLFQEKRSGE